MALSDRSHQRASRWRRWSTSASSSGRSAKRALLAAWTAVFDLPAQSLGLLREPDRHGVAIETSSTTPKAEAEIACAELGRPEIAAIIELFDGEKRALVQTFLSQQTLPDAVNEAFVAAVNDALQGMERLAIPAEDLLLAVAGDGTPTKGPQGHKCHRLPRDEFALSQVEPNATGQRCGPGWYA